MPATPPASLPAQVHIAPVRHLAFPQLCTGTIRHCGLPGHIGKWLALHPEIKDTAEDLSFRCGSKWGKKRSEGEKRYKDAKEAKVRKLARQEMGKQIVATLFNAGMAGPLTPGTGDTAVATAAGALAGSPAAAAAIQAALAGGNGQ